MAPISAAAAKALVKRLHYSGTVAANSQLHLGVFLGKSLEGAMQFGPSMDKSRLQGLVAGTGWNEFLELNRLAFSEALPRNSESRALSIAFRMIKKQYPHIKWVVSFADGTRCGDGAIYRAAGFVLTSVKENTTIWKSPTGEIATNLSLKLKNTTSAMKQFREAGWLPLVGFQMRYIYFLDPSAKDRLTVPILPFSKIDEAGAGMYRGRAKQAMTEYPSGQRRGSTDPHAPQKKAGTRPAVSQYREG